MNASARLLVFALIAATVTGSAYMVGEYGGRFGLENLSRQMVGACATDEVVTDRQACLRDLATYGDMVRWCATELLIVDRDACHTAMRQAYLEGLR